jgi:phage terminase large subunit-like protein
MDLVSGDIVHGGDPVLRWQISNVHLDTDPAGNIKISKKKTKHGEKVDGLVALAMAYGSWIQNTTDASPPIDYSTILSL